MSKRSIICEYRDGRYDYAFVQNEMKPTDINVGPNEVCIKVHACFIAHQQLDVLTRLFTKKAQLSFSPASCIAGTVLQVGTMVTNFKENDRVVACIPLDSQHSGCADICLVNEIYVVNLPPEVEYPEGTILMNYGVRAYMALQYLARLKPDDHVVIFNASSSAGCLLVQLAKLWNANVIAIVLKKDDKIHLQKLKNPPDSILDVEAGTTNLLPSILDATGQLGADVVIDDGVRLFTSEKESLVVKDDLSSWKPTKQEVISCLSVGGRWITCNPLLQMDPGDSMQMYLKQASLGYLFDQAWVLSSSKQGKWMYIVKDLLTKVQEGLIQLPTHMTPFIQFNDVINLDVNHSDVVVSMET